MSTTRTAPEPPGIAVRELRPTGTWRGVELWGWCAYAITASFAALLLYLGLRPGGRGPLYAYSLGRPVLEMLALLFLFIGGLWSVLHRPVLQRHRLAPALCLAAGLALMSYPFPYPSSHEGHPSGTCFRLPVDGPWTVVWGGDATEDNRNAGFFPDRRWALDLVVTQEGSSHRGEGLEATDYYAYGRDVLAPADGEVVRVMTGIADSPPGTYDSRVERFGNHVVIQVADREFAFLCHLKDGSIAVEPGRRVRRGDPIARVGNSGFSTVTPEPHLSVHLQDSAELRQGEAVPWSFCDYVADGRTVERGLPHGGVRADGTFRGEIVQAASERSR